MAKKVKTVKELLREKTEGNLALIVDRQAQVEDEKQNPDVFAGSIDYFRRCARKDGKDPTSIVFSRGEREGD